MRAPVSWPLNKFGKYDLGGQISIDRTEPFELGWTTKQDRDYRAFVALAQAVGALLVAQGSHQIR